MCNKICKTCKKELDIEYFHKNGKKRNGEQRFKPHCKKCSNARWLYKLVKNISRRSNKGGKSDVTMEFIKNLYDKQSGKCYWLGIELDITGKDILRKPSLDRLDNSRGYFRDNIVITTIFANTGRRDATTTEMSIFIKKHLSKININGSQPTRTQTRS